MGDFAWSALAVPYATLAVALVALGLTALLIRGDGVLRLALIGAVSNTLPWAVTSALAACTTDAETATRLLRVGNGPVALLGSSLMLLILGAYGQTERYRRLLIGASVAGTLSLAICWTTELVIPGVRLTPSGMLYPRAGPLTIVHAGQLALWPVLGLAIVRRTAGDQPPRMRPWQLITLVMFVVAATADVLLAHGIAGYYPFAWLPGLGAVALCFHLIKVFHFSLFLSIWFDFDLRFRYQTAREERDQEN